MKNKSIIGINEYQIEKFMRLSTVLLIITINLITNSFANTTYAQEIQISIHVKNMNIKDVFREIEKRVILSFLSLIMI
jgi:hypothetical protein